MLCPKRHIKYLSELNDKERLEFWKADAEIIRAYKGLGIKKIRMQLHSRYKGSKAKDQNDHLHVHYYKFKEGDFKILLSKTAHKQDMVKMLKGLFKK